jgi:excisionase family DNA binding protein
MTTQSQPAALLRSREAAAHLGFSVDTLKHWRKHGGGPAFVRIGTRVRYRKEALDAWIAAREVAAS